MGIIKNIIILTVICSITAAYSPRAALRSNFVFNSNEKADTGWMDLFNGNSLAGWHVYGKSNPASAWTADNGTIHLRPGKKSGYQTVNGGDLVTDEAYQNFTLEIEWRISKGANSGIILYVQEDTIKYKETWHTGFEIQVCDNENNVDAHVHKRDAGAVYDLVPVTAEAAKGYDQWNKVRIISNQGNVEVFLNGIKNLSFSTSGNDWKKRIAESKFKNMPGFGTFKSGRIALQDHGQEVWYRNIRIKKIG